ncbi:MAG: hypothetical protein EBR28_11340 [Planctomycetia bacterium]|nr:hypothetical protein [Planctomycetia bacterium]
MVRAPRRARLRPPDTRRRRSAALGNPRPARCARAGRRPGPAAAFPAPLRRAHRRRRAGRARGARRPGAAAVACP